MRAGFLIERSIKRPSLMMGNVSTEESRKEMRNSPGAPRPPARVPIFCIHELNFEGTPPPQPHIFYAQARHLPCSQRILRFECNQSRRGRSELIGLAAR